MIARPFRDLAARCAHLEQQLAAAVTTGKALIAEVPAYVGPDNWDGRIARLIREAKAALTDADMPPRRLADQLDTLQRERNVLLTACKLLLDRLEREGTGTADTWQAIELAREAIRTVEPIDALPADAELPPRAEILDAEPAE